MRTTKIMTRTTRFKILAVLQLPTFGSNFATLLLFCMTVHEFHSYYRDVRFQILV